MTWYKLRRENGLIEIQCEHGVGHPSQRLTDPQYYYGVHGCDGCCGHPEFNDAEKAMTANKLLRQAAF